MDVAQFDFDLPDERIALRPAVPREAARLLVVYPDATLEHARIADLPRFFQAGDALVVNDTKVIPARLHGRRLPRPGQDGGGPKIEVTLHRRVAADRYLAFAKPARKLVPEDHVRFGEGLDAMVIARGEGGEVELGFALAGSTLDAAILREGEVPLPPYIAGKRKPDAQDLSDYQTMFARDAGSVAAPTAGLHFTPALIAALEKQGVTCEQVTLHVGAGTFLPVTVEDTTEHRMHPEYAELTEETARQLEAARARGGRIAAVGTTSLRTLESAADAEGRLHGFAGETRLFITPGYRFKAVDILLTNFHLPRSTLFMLVCAFSGTEVMKRAYAEAIARQYRFYSYGDACLLFRPGPGQ
jgi:S-adenosylmethionine:tRNA ribosyltransferase-isomerase